MKTFTAQQIAALAAIDEGSLTGVKAFNDTSQRVHVGLDEGSFASSPICGALARRRNTETTDALANCPDCKALMRLAGKNLAGLFEGVPDDYDSCADRRSVDYLGPR